MQVIKKIFITILIVMSLAVSCFGATFLTEEQIKNTSQMQLNDIIEKADNGDYASQKFLSEYYIRTKNKEFDMKYMGNIAKHIDFYRDKDSKYITEELATYSLSTVMLAYKNSIHFSSADKANLNTRRDNILTIIEELSLNLLYPKASLTLAKYYLTANKPALAEMYLFVAIGGMNALEKYNLNLHHTDRDAVKNDILNQISALNWDKVNNEFVTNITKVNNTVHYKEIGSNIVLDPKNESMYALIRRDYNELNCSNHLVKTTNMELLFPTKNGFETRLKSDKPKESEASNEIFDFLCSEKTKAKAKIPSAYYGTGFVVNNGIIVTNYHVLSGKNKITLMLNDGSQIEATVVAQDEHNDIALLRSEHLKAPGLDISKSALKTGTKIFTIGYPHPDVMGTEAKTADGIINSLSGIANDPRQMQISIPVQSGNSGGPVVNMSGEVVGIVVSKLSASKMLSMTGDTVQNVNYAIKTPYLTALLESLQESVLKKKSSSIKSKKLEDVSALVKKSVVLIKAE